MNIRQARHEAKNLWGKFVGDLKRTEIESIARSLGVKVLYEDLDSDVSGILVIKDSQPTIFVNASDHRNRQRFTIAHEIGHFLLHKREGVHVDRDYTVAYRNTKSAMGEEGEEIEANQFAAELLMPAEGIVRFLKKHETEKITDLTVEKLANFFEVSEQAMTIRLTSLGYI